ncbi:S1C family serine protease [Planctomycetota bacterium]
MRKSFLLLLAILIPAGSATPAYAGPLERLGEVYASVSDSVADSVVQITVQRKPGSEKKVEPRKDPFSPIENEKYFVRPDSPVSGVMIDKNGYIITSNYNVTGGEVEKVTVTLNTGDSYEAKVLGRHENLDIALLKINGEGPFKPALLADEAGTYPGQMVMVVGKSHHYEQHTVTTGIVSAHNRIHETALQISCRLNFGNTGGALVDLDGRLMGITVFIRPNNRTGLNSGVGFAIPWEKIKPLMAELKQSKIWQKTTSGISGPFLGVGMAEEQPDAGKGVRIGRVIPGSAAEEIGLKPGDIVLALNDKPVKTWRDILLAIRSSKVGDKLKIKYSRNGEILTQSAILKERPPDY